MVVNVIQMVAVATLAHAQQDSQELTVKLQTLAPLLNVWTELLHNHSVPLVHVSAQHSTQEHSVKRLSINALQTHASMVVLAQLHRTHSPANVYQATQELPALHLIHV